MLSRKIKSGHLRRPRSKRPSRLAFLPKKNTSRRARRFIITIFATDFSVSLRRFKTAPRNRTKLKKQTVYKLGLLGYKEVAITLEHTDLPSLGPLLPTMPAGAVATGAVVLGLSGVLVFSLNLTTPKNLVPVAKSYALQQAKTTHPAPKSPSLPASTPVALRIPKIDLDTQIAPVGLNSDGSLAVPDTPDEAGWYTHSPTPGQIGPAVIDGHVDWVTGIAVFWRLRELTPGDVISVDRADGTTANFKVDSVSQLPQNQFPTQAVYGNIDYAGIRLVTCGGVFSTATHHYSDNMVVFGSLMQ